MTVVLDKCRCTNASHYIHTGVGCQNAAPHHNYCGWCQAAGDCDGGVVTVSPKEMAPFTDAEIEAFRHQINSPLIKRFLATFEEIVEISDRMRESDLALRQISNAGPDETTVHAMMRLAEERTAEWFAEVQRRDAEIARLRAATGPDCPRCGHFLKAEHGRSYNPVRNAMRRYCKYRGVHRDCKCEVWESELLSDHPDVAKDCGIV